MRRDRRDVLKYGALVAASGLEASPAIGKAIGSAAGKRPNIILILADDMGYSDIGCFGSEIPTPNLDRLAAHGMRFAQFYNSPRCCPSRASLMTGLYSHQAHMGMMVDDHGRYPYPAYDGDLNKGAVTTAEVLKSGGYSTYMTGKWHLTWHQTTETSADKSNWPLQRGFDRYYGIITGAADYYNPATLVQDNTPIKATDPNFYLTNAIADHSVKFIEEAPKDKPFFIYNAFNAPHWPLHAPEETVAKHRARYQQGWDKTRADRHASQIKQGLIDAKWEITDRDPRVPPWERASLHDWEAERMAVYAAQVDLLDQGVGRIIDALERRGELDNTLIFFMADNGGNYEEFGPRDPKDKKWPLFMNSHTRNGRPMRVGNTPSIMPGPDDTYTSYGGPWGNVSNTPFRMYKHFAHEGGISTPLIAHWPSGIGRPGSVTQQIGHEIDIMATCLAVSGTPYPGTSKAGTPPPPPEGRSLLPAFAGKDIDNRGMIFWEHEGNCAARDGKWKLVSRFPDGWELYDMETDRTETHDLADKLPDQVKRLSAAYDGWAKRVGARPWPMPGTPAGARTGALPMPDYLRVDRPIGFEVDPG